MWSSDCRLQSNRVPKNVLPFHTAFIKIKPEIKIETNYILVQIGVTHGHKILQKQDMCHVTCTEKRASLFSFQARSSSILVMGLASKGREEIKRNRLGMRTPIFSSLSLYSISFTFLCSLSYAVFPLLTRRDKSSMELVLFALHN